MLGFDWDEANLHHIALHSVTPEEVEQVLQGPTFEIDAYELNGEERIEEVGATQSGRILKIVTTVRNGLIRVVTAYDAVSAIKQAFMEQQKRLYE
ncbi:BrnT family toxin [Granulicella sp. WH15]|uniref:BrnT family toxin n=1 Tax=Granulicella sp. WH15 TaxID=2602070 RepID=UPI0013672C0D|nr:BrnT family toxin [Granulicella sp. WH15]QHN05074.1 BrnT family toxin [Granulicella sp. WH15]